MNWRTLRLLYVHEMRILLRSRRTVVMSIVIPAIIMPVMLFGTRYSESARQQRLTDRTYRYTVVGSWAEQARQWIEQTGANDADFHDFLAEELPSAAPASDLQAGRIDFYVNTMAAGADPNSDRIRSVQVFFKGNQDVSRGGSERMIRLLHAAQQQQRNDLLINRGFAAEPDRVFSVREESVASEAQVSGSMVGRFVTGILVMLIFSGGSIAAMDIIVGEKERGTLETLITTAAGRVEIVGAKQLAIFSAALVTTLIQALNFLLYVQMELVELPASFSMNIPASHIFALFALFVPLAGAIAAILLIISAYAKTYKEAQLHFFPICLVSLAPALASVLPGLQLRSIVAFVPIANVSVATREVLTGRPDPLMILVTFAVMSVTALGLVRFSAQLLAREDIVVPTQGDQASLAGGDALFRRRAPAWFAVMWAVMFAGAANIAALQHFQTQLLFNEIVVFLGGSLVMIRLYKLDLRETLRLRRPRWTVWLGIAVAIPAAQITGVAIFKMANMVIPAPLRLLEEFSRQVMAENLPSWQMYALLAILPAICEEIAFRGVLLHGLRRRFRPVALCLVVGVVFGLFHYSLFRIVSTAFLGTILTAVALMTGSIAPGMFLHAGNNALALWAANAEFPLDQLAWRDYGAAALILMLALWIIYRAGKRE